MAARQSAQRRDLLAQVSRAIEWLGDVCDGSLLGSGQSNGISHIVDNLLNFLQINDSAIPEGHEIKNLIEAVLNKDTNGDKLAEISERIEELRDLLAKKYGRV